MKRLTFCLLSVCALSLSGCCWPGMMPFGGCGGGCAPGGYPGAYPGAQMTPTGWEASYAPVQQGVPTTTIAPIAAQQMVTSPVAYQQMQPTIALESLPTYR